MISNTFRGFRCARFQLPCNGTGLGTSGGMAGLAVREFDARMIHGLVDETSARPQHSADAQLGIREIEALRLNVDGVAPPEAATMAEPLVALFRGEMTTGDDLRLPPAANHTGPAVRSAINRILAADSRGVPFGDRDAVRKEEQMRSLLKAFLSTASRIQGRAALRSEE